MFELFKRSDVSGTATVSKAHEDKFPITPQGYRSDPFNAGLQYVKDHEGEELDFEEFANYMGYKDAHNVYWLLRQLRMKNAITKIGGRDSKTYEVNKTRLNTSRSKAQRKASSKTVSVSDTALRKILRYIYLTQGKTVTQTSIHKSTGYSQGHTSRTIQALTRLGLITKASESNDGTVFRVTDKGLKALGSEQVEKTESKPAQSKVPELARLVWRYVNEKRNINLLQFLDWVEKKAEK